jgi:predicted negative regulator of RcsB-dependent stress response
VRTSERRQLKQDKFAQTTGEIISEAVAHSRSLIITAVITAIMLALALGSGWYWNYRNQQANLALGKAMDSYNAPLRPPDTPAQEDTTAPSFPSALERARTARQQFQQIARKYGFTKSGQAARYMAALTAIDMGDSMAGEQELKQVADSRNHDMAALAKLALAGVYTNSNRSKEALQLYQYLVSHPTDSVSKEMAELELASLYTASNQAAEATKVYNQLIKDNPKGAAASIAQQRLQAMK